MQSRREYDPSAVEKNPSPTAGVESMPTPLPRTRVPSGAPREILVGFVEAAMAAGILPTAVARLLERDPLAAVELCGATSLEQLEALRGRVLDAGLVYLPPPAEDPLLVAEALWSDPLLAVLPESHPFAGAPAVALDALGTAPLVFFRRALARHRFDEVLRACHRHGYVPSRVQEVTMFHSVVSLVAGGVGIGLVPASLRALQQPGVAFAAVPELSAEFVVHLVTHRKRASPLVEAFVEEVHAALAPVR